MVWMCRSVAGRSARVGGKSPSGLSAALLVAALQLATVAARETFPTDVKPEDLDCHLYFEGNSENCKDYMDGVVYESNFTVAWAMCLAAITITSLSCCYCMCIGPDANGAPRFCCCIPMPACCRPALTAGAARSVPRDPYTKKAVSPTSGAAMHNLAPAALKQKMDPKGSKHGCMYFLLVLLMIFLLAPSVLLYTSNVNMDAATTSTQDAVSELFADVGDAICSRDDAIVEAARDDVDDSCQAASFVGYLNDLANSTDAIFNDTLALVELYDEMRLIFDETNDDLIDQRAELQKVETTYLPDARTAIAELNNAFEALKFLDEPGLDISSVDVDVTTNDPEIVAPGSNNETIAFAALDAMEAAYDEAIDAVEAADDSMDSADPVVLEIKDNLDPNTGSLREEILGEVLGDIRKTFLDFNKDAIDYKGDVDEQESGVEDALSYKTIGLFVFAFLPLIVLFVSTLCACAKERPWPLGCNIVLSYCIMGPFIVLAIVVSLLNVVVYDACEVHLPLVEAQFDGDTFEVVDNTVDLYPAIEGTLFCDNVASPPPRDETFPWAEPNNNYLDIWGVGSVLNVSDTIDPLLADVDEVLDLLVGGDELDNIRANFTDALPVTVTFMTIDYTIESPVDFLFSNPGDISQYVSDATAVRAAANSHSDDSKYAAQVLLDAALAAQEAVINLEEAAGPDYETSFNNALDDIDTILDQLRTGLESIQTRLGNIVDDVAEANNYLLCGYVGDFYQSTVLGDVCTDFETSLANMYLPLALVVLGMALTFMVVARYFVRERFLLKMQQQDPAFPSNFRQVVRGRGIKKNGLASSATVSTSSSYERPQVAVNNTAGVGPSYASAKSYGA